MNNTENKIRPSGHVTDELSDDMEMVSPGVMLRDAREKLGLTQENIAKRLNFKEALVDALENDNLDPSLPATFNRGYLCSYAKIVAVEIEDVLASHDALGAAQTQRSELQSFSNLTIKEAEHSRVMWLSYLIIAILVGLTVLWWMQEAEQKPTTSTAEATLIEEEAKQEPTNESRMDQAENAELVLAEQTDKLQRSLEQTTNETKIAPDSNKPENISLGEQVLPEVTESLVANQNDQADARESNESSVSDSVVELTDNVLATGVFTFSGDCWVNIYDATGERVAWGVKKSGYVMTVKGQAPLRVTLGKPELATILYNEEPVDLSSFNVGNIAKFTLPLSAKEER